MQARNVHYFVYIFGDQPRKDVQIGIAGDLQQQVHLIKTSPSQGARPPQEVKLVYYEHYDVEEIALARERQIKQGGVDSTFSLIESMNPNWLDLSDTLEA
ncbi:MAG: excinuclease ABC subunit C [Hymenobacteraceae bacterium]|nr:excinuclease ABC subunit C [Hymenobacteraceae bacterium]